MGAGDRGRAGVGGRALRSGRSGPCTETGRTGGWGLGHGCDTPATHANACERLRTLRERFANALATIPGQRLDPWTPTFKTGTLLLRIREKKIHLRSSNNKNWGLDSRLDISALDWALNPKP